MVVLASNLISAYLSSGGGGGNLDALTDVVIGTPYTLTNGDVLVYDGADWINSPDIGGALSSISTFINPVTRQTNSNEITAISVGATAPSTPATGDLWVDTN